MNEYKVYEAVKEAVKEALPGAIMAVMDVKSKLDNLPEYPLQSEVAEILGIARSAVSRYIRRGELDVVYLKGSNRPRLDKKQVLELIIKYKT